MAYDTGFFCIILPDTVSAPLPPGSKAALLAYRTGPGPGLLRLGAPTPLPEGSLLMGAAGDPFPPGDPGPWARQWAAECRLRRAAGVWLDGEGNSPALRRGISLLSRVLGRAGLALWVPEGWGDWAAGSRVVLSSALSGGSFSLRLREGLDRWGAGRLVLGLDRLGMDFPLPCPTGQGEDCPPERLQALLSRWRPRSYWSEELAAAYFTYPGPSGPRLVLYDTAESWKAKLRTARELGVNTAAAPYAQLAPWLDRMGELGGRGDSGWPAGNPSVPPGNPSVCPSGSQLPFGKGEPVAWH